jgi:hypothetical protein
LYATNVKPEIDQDVYDEYWSEIRRRSTASAKRVA